MGENRGMVAHLPVFGKLMHFVPVMLGLLLWLILGDMIAEFGEFFQRDCFGT